MKVEMVVRVAVPDLDAADRAEAFAEAVGRAVDKAYLRAIDKAALYGAGVKMPMGILTRLAQTAEPASYPADAPAWSGPKPAPR